MNLLYDCFRDSNKYMNWRWISNQVLSYIDSGPVEAYHKYNVTEGTKYDVKLYLFVLI